MREEWEKYPDTVQKCIEILNEGRKSVKPFTTVLALLLQYGDSLGMRTGGDHSIISYVYMEVRNSKMGGRLDEVQPTMDNASTANPYFVEVQAESH